ncbi:MAG TPA: cation diffusion facilitator family transporter [Anaerolineales bacterium]|jgi:cation diffusion facilitator family transporter
MKIETLTPSAEKVSITRFAWLSIAAALTTIAMKWIAYLVTGSVGMLSDAMESVVNLLGAAMALGMLTIAARPADQGHSFGHTKAEYFSSAVEGILILVAAAGIAYTAIERLMNPRPLEQIGIGLVVSIAASLVNFFVSRVLRTAGRKHRSITLEADAQHLMTDVWTSAGVIAGIGLVALTGWQRLDPIVGLIVAVNIVWTGVGLVRSSIDGLMDISLPAIEQEKIENIMAGYRQMKVEFHALRTRQSASQRFIDIHMYVPAAWTVREAHLIAKKFEGEVRAAVGEAFINTHVEPAEDYRQD